MKRILSHASYANVMATVAVFIALGGAGYAATQLPADSVGPDQLQHDAVTSGAIKNGSVRRADLSARNWDGTTYSVSKRIANNTSEPAPFNFTSANVFCDAGDPQIGGGFSGLDPSVGTVTRNSPIKSQSNDPALRLEGWQFAYENAAPGITSNVVVIVRCADFPPARLQS